MCQISPKLKGVSILNPDDQTTQPPGGSEPQGGDQPTAAPAEKCVTCGNTASGGNCVACGQGEVSCTCPQPSPEGGQGGGPAQGGPMPGGEQPSGVPPAV